MHWRLQVDGRLSDILSGIDKLLHPAAHTALHAPLHSAPGCVALPQVKSLKSQL